jgi:hypothetical protein
MAKCSNINQYLIFLIKKINVATTNKIPPLLWLSGYLLVPARLHFFFVELAGFEPLHPLLK